MMALWLVVATAWSGPETDAAGLSEAWLGADSPNDLKRAAAIAPFTVDHGRRVTENRVLEHRILAAPEALRTLHARGFPVRRVSRQRDSAEGYTTVDEGRAWLAELAVLSHRAGIQVLGTSALGEPIEALWVGQAPSSGAPAVRLLGAVHGDEATSFEVALATAAALVRGDGMEADVTALLDRTTVWVVPFVNPDGVRARSRYNANGIDINRNYDYEWRRTSLGAGSHPFSEPETRATRALSLFGSHPHLSLSLHSGAENIGYVWNFTHDDSPDEVLLASIATAYSAGISDDFEATNGADWYISNGDTNDWSYGRYGGLDFTVELSLRKTPDIEDIPEFVAQHVPTIIELFGRTPTVSGRIRSASTQRPVGARLQLLDSSGAAASAPFFAHSSTGRFHRIGTPEATTLLIDSPGFASVEVPAETVEINLVATGIQPPSLPFVVASGDPVWLPATDTGFATLSRPGMASKQVELFWGLLIVPDLEPGPWTVSMGEQAWPNGLFVSDSETVAKSWNRSADTLTATMGQSVPDGVRAFLLVGDDRPLQEVVANRTADDTVEIELGDLSQRDDADVILLSGGHLIALEDINGIDPTRAPTKLPLVRGSGIGCNTSGQPLSMPIWAVLLLVALRSTSRRT